MQEEDYGRIHAEAIERYHSIKERSGLGNVPSVVVEGKEIFFRGRVADPDNLTPVENHFSYPPRRFCSEYGRANIPSFPVFYAAESPVTIANELRLGPESWLHIAVFYMPARERIDRLLLIHDDFKSGRPWAKHRDDLKSYMFNLPDQSDPAEEWRRLQETARQFRSDCYEGTSAISHFWLYHVGLDGVIYPSLRTDDFCNFAMHPRFVDRCLKLYCVHACFWTVDRLHLLHTGYPAAEGQLAWTPSTQAQADEWSQGFKALL